MARLTNDEFDELHRLTGEALIAMLKAAKGEGAEPLSPAFVAQAIKFLGENKINSPASTARKVSTTSRPPESWQDEDTILPFKKAE